MPDELYVEDMSKVPDSDRPDEGPARVRIASVKTRDDNGNQLLSSKGFPIVQLQLKIQDEGANFGRTVPDSPSLQPHALFKLKAYYKATGYTPGPEGHNPHKLLDGECYVLIQHGSFEGRDTINIPPWSIKSLQEGPVKSRQKAAA